MHWSAVEACGPTAIISDCYGIQKVLENFSGQASCFWRGWAPCRRKLWICLKQKLLCWMSEQAELQHTLLLLLTSAANLTTDCYQSRLCSAHQQIKWVNKLDCAKHMLWIWLTKGLNEMGAAQRLCPVISRSLKRVSILPVNGASIQPASPSSPSLHGKRISHRCSFNGCEREGAS